MESSWLSYAKRIQSIADTGMTFATDDFDKERYQELADIGNKMLAELGNVPIERIENLLGDLGNGYATPKVDVRGAVVNNNKILLVREKTDGLWALPGGYADSGLSASQNVKKEISEEAQIEVTVTSLYAIKHKAQHDYAPDVREFYKLFFLCKQNDERVMATPGMEVSDVDFFSFSQLPPLSTGRVNLNDIETAFAASAGKLAKVLFD
ncbi:NUDIX hydrolase [Pseudomonadales bacterium]|nr:NUDIX hydrolase [Pseudomonadales bacterium]MDB2596581.1 NUDIX hydrolase [Pseudomonadales bacterium]MDC1322517.1 NUDIX hydrolase [Pseudomonadales bacterium]